MFWPIIQEKGVKCDSNNYHANGSELPPPPLLPHDLLNVILGFYTFPDYYNFIQR